MKQLILVRHAKSSWKHNVIDHERPLNNRGFNDAQIISNHLKNSNLNIELVLSSDAMRAKTTANLFVSNLGISQEIFSLHPDLYDFSGENLIKTIKNCDDQINYLMVFGHNHAITAFVNSYGDKYIDNVPTCGVVIIEFEINSWKNLNKGKTLKTVFPRDLK
tara:strand:+ start:681 stop:1166 length:486 start_codon:yes stop_codon:yes gene_type:complete